VGPLEEVIKGGTRELMLPAAEGVAERRGVSALRPLLLYVRAGQGGERERALRALGALGDERGLSELEVVASGGTEEAPADVSMQQAAVEGLGRLSPQLKDAEAQKRLLERMENWASDAGPLRRSAVIGLRSMGGEKARLRIEAVLSDTSAAVDVAQVAAEQLGKFKDPASEPVLARTIKEHGNQAVRKAAREALDATFPTERTRIEFMAVDSRFPEISDPAAAYLAAEGDPALLVPRLGTLKRPELRQHLAYGLLRRSALPVAELTGLLRSASPETREQAAWLIGNALGQDTSKVAVSDVQTLGEALTRAEAEVAQMWSGTAPQLRAATSKAWVRLLWAQGQAGASRVADVAAQRLVSSELAVPAAVRTEAAELLSRRGTAAQAQAAEKALQDPEPAVRAAAAQTLVKLVGAKAGDAVVETTPFDAIAFAAAGKSLADSGRVDSHAARQLSVPVLIAWKDSSALREAARDEDKVTRMDALAALGRIPTEEAFALLSEIAFDEEESEDVKKAAYRALKRGKRLAEKAQKAAAPAAGSAR
jgi:ParB family chromosome partitioning protein